VLLDIVEHLAKLFRVEFDPRMEILGDQCRDIFVDELWGSTFSVNHELRPVVDPVDDADRCLEDSVRVRSDCHDRAKRHRRIWVWKVGRLDILDIAERLHNGCVDVCRWIVRPQGLVTENLDATMIEI